MSLKQNTICLVVTLLCRNVVLEIPGSGSDSEAGDHLNRLLIKYSSETQANSISLPQGIVPYYIDRKSFDAIIAVRIRNAMSTIESSSCVVFKEIPIKPAETNLGYNWLFIENKGGIRECVHTIMQGEFGKFIMVVGFDCMTRRDIIHGLMHVLGFRDEVTHPQRDMYIRVIWSNIQPNYRHLFWIHPDATPLKSVVEYDTMSVMHFHDRAYSVNGGATIAPLLPGLLINPSDKLSQLDIMKLRLAFGQECNKRKVGNLVQTCEKAFKAQAGGITVIESSSEWGSSQEEKNNKSVEASGESVEALGESVEGTGEPDEGPEEPEIVYLSSVERRKLSHKSKTKE